MLARALFIPLSFPLLALSCYCWAGNGLVDRTWTASGMDSYSYRQALRQPTVGSRYTLFNITPDMPTPGGTSPVGTKGIRYIAMKYGPYGQPEHYNVLSLFHHHHT